MDIITSVEDWQKNTTTGVTSKTWMGTPVVMPVSFGKVARETVQNGKRVNLIFPGWELPPTTVMRFNRSKRIETTAMVGSDATVKEFIGWNDWQITVEGVILPTTRGNCSYDSEGLSFLKILDEIDTSVPIYSPICEMLSIYDVIVERIELEKMTGNSQPFVLSLISDKTDNFLLF